MEILSMILLSVSLSMDAFGIGISYSLRKIRILLKAKIIVSLISVIFTAAAVFLGSIIASFVTPIISKIIGCSMLILLGIFTIVQGLKKDTGEKKCTGAKKIWNFAIKSLGITVNIIKHPISCDFDNSKHIDLFESIYLGVALSIDSIAAGIGLSISGASSFLVPVLVGVAQFVFLSLGSVLGNKISSVKNVDFRIFVFISGAVLIVLSLLRLF